MRSFLSPLSRWVLLAVPLALNGCGDDFALPGLEINEVGPVDGDYIELINTGAETLDLSGYRLTDLDRGTGGPRPDEQVIFEDGATLAPGEILLIVANLGADALPGERTECGPGAPMRCYYASWGISNAEGDSLFVLAPDGSRILSYDYPAMSVMTGAWGRVPDGTGEFGPATRTPGQPNSR